MSRNHKRFARWAALMALLLLGLPAHAAAENYGVTVLLVSEGKGGVDPGAARYHKILRKRLRYESLRLVSQQQRSVATDAIGSVPVPGAEAFRFRPIDTGGKGILVAVEWGPTRGDFRLRKGKPLILGGPATAGGELVVVLEAR